MELAVRSLEEPDEVRDLDGGALALVSAGGVTVARATYEPGWTWSERVGARTGEPLCREEHVVLVVAGRAEITMEDGRSVEVGAGDLCAVPAGHDFRVVGEEAYVSLHFHGAEGYGRR